MNVLTLGTFDLFHAGHVKLLERCHLLGKVTVGLNTDAFVERYKGRRPVISWADRATVLRACRYVHTVIPNAQATGSAKATITVANPDIIIAGDDWRDRDYLGQLGVTQSWLDDRRIKVEYLPYTQGISTTAIRARL